MNEKYSVLLWSDAASDHPLPDLSTYLHPLLILRTDRGDLCVRTRHIIGYVTAKGFFLPCSENRHLTQLLHNTWHSLAASQFREIPRKFGHEAVANRRKNPTRARDSNCRDRVRIPSTKMWT